jgi:hypothetical protein
VLRDTAAGRGAEAYAGARRGSKRKPPTGGIGIGRTTAACLASCLCVVVLVGGGVVAVLHSGRCGSSGPGRSREQHVRVRVDKGILATSSSPLPCLFSRQDQLAAPPAASTRYYWPPVSSSGSPQRGVAATSRPPRSGSPAASLKKIGVVED